ncbi:MAG: methylenetetrahydrofolate reductase [Cyanobacteria bacterium J06607_6]
MQFSIEVTPKVDVSALPKGIREVSITYLPGADDRDVVAQAVKLRQLGVDPIPHVPARSIRDLANLTRYLTALKTEADVRQVLIIGGSPDRPAGPFTSTLDLLETGLFDGLRVGVAGHPEGMPVLSEQECDGPLGPVSDHRFLALKNQYARDTGTEMFVMTQWSLDVPTIHRWLDRIEAFNTLPIYLGIPGPTTPATLLKFAQICGVKTSLLGLRNQSGRLGKLLTVQSPDYLVEGLGGRIQNFHIYTFGGVRRTRDWLATRQSNLAVSA